MDLFRNCLEPLDRVLRDAKMDKSSINEVVLVGGPTRIPKVQRWLCGSTSREGPNRFVNNSNEAVVYGAAVQALLPSSLMQLAPRPGRAAPRCDASHAGH